MQMKKIYAVAILLAISTLHSLACTNVIVTKGASADSSVMVTYAADSHQLYGCLYFHPAKKWKEGLCSRYTTGMKGIIWARYRR